MLHWHDPNTAKVSFKTLVKSSNHRRFSKSMPFFTISRPHSHKLKEKVKKYQMNRAHATDFVTVAMFGAWTRYLAGEHGLIISGGGLFYNDYPDYPKAKDTLQSTWTLSSGPLRQATCCGHFVLLDITGDRLRDGDSAVERKAKGKELDDVESHLEFASSVCSPAVACLAWYQAKMNSTERSTRRCSPVTINTLEFWPGWRTTFKQFREIYLRGKKKPHNSWQKNSELSLLGIRRINKNWRTAVNSLILEEKPPNNSHIKLTQFLIFKKTS